MVRYGQDTTRPESRCRLWIPADWLLPLNLGQLCRQQIHRASASVVRENKVGNERRLKGLTKSRTTLETDLLRLTGIAWSASEKVERASNRQRMHGISKYVLAWLYADDTQADR